VHSRWVLRLPLKIGDGTGFAVGASGNLDDLHIYNADNYLYALLDAIVHNPEPRESREDQFWFVAGEWIAAYPHAHEAKGRFGRKRARRAANAGRGVSP